MDPPEDPDRELLPKPFAPPVEARAPAATDETQFVRGIGRLAAISLVVGSMIGSGIFIVSADIGPGSALGPGGLLLVWAVTGAITITGALAYAELAAMMPNAGGQYVFLREGLAPSAGFLYGWTLFDVIQSGTIAAVAVAFGRFLGVLIPSLTPDVFLKLGSFHMPGGTIQLGLSPQRVVAIVMVAVLTAVNIRGVRLGAAIQTGFTVAKVAALSALILLGLTIFRRPDVAAANFDSFWGTGPLGARGAPGPRRCDGGVALLERCLEQRHLRRGRGARSPAQPAAGARPRNRPGQSALRGGERRLPQRAAVLGRPQWRRRARPGHSVRGAGSGGHRRHGGDAGTVRGDRHGDRDSDLHLRLQQRTHPRGRAGVLRHGAGPPVLPAGRRAAPRVPHPVSASSLRPSGPWCCA